MYIGREKSVVKWFVLFNFANSGKYNLFIFFRLYWSYNVFFKHV